MHIQRDTIHRAKHWYKFLTPTWNSILKQSCGTHLSQFNKLQINHFIPP